MSVVPDQVYSKLLEESLQEGLFLEQINAGRMAQVILGLPRDPAFKKLSASVKEEIQSIITAIE